jgi:hypothetical protein
MDRIDRMMGKAHAKPRSHQGQKSAIFTHRIHPQSLPSTASIARIPLKTKKRHQKSPVRRKTSRFSRK